MVDAIFRAWIGSTLEVYVDDMLVKSKLRKDHHHDLRDIFEAMRKHHMKVNPEKCTFGVTSGKFLGYLVKKRGIEVDPVKIQAIVEMPSPKNLKEVQKLNGSIASLGRFIARSSEKCKHFFNILKKGSKFEWTAECEEAFQKIKEHLASILILQKPDPDEVLAFYIAATEDAVSAVLVKTNTKIEQPIYYVSKTLNSAERNYTKIEQLILALVWATQKLRTYLLTHFIRVPCKAPLEAVLKSAGKMGRIAKWNTHLDQFNIIYEIQHSRKSQVLADFLADLPLDNDEEIEGIPEAEEESKDSMDILEPSSQRQWEVFVDGSKNKEGAGIGILVIRQIGLEYNVYDDTLSTYMALVQTLASQIPNIKFRHLCRRDLRHADALTYISSMLKDKSVEVIKITRVYEASISSQFSFATNQDTVEENIEDQVGEDIHNDFDEEDILSRANQDEDFSNEDDWRKVIHAFLQEGTLPADHKQARKILSKAGRYDLRDGILYKKSFLGPLLRCLSRKEGHQILKDIHYGDAGNHSGMRSLADKPKIQGYYWPTMIQDAARMSRRCEECQRFAKKIHAPATTLNSVGSPWPFVKWCVDIVGPFIEGSGKRRFLIVATDYFSKWVEAKALSRIRDVDVFTFIFQNIICRFGIPAEIVFDNGKQLQGKNIDMLFDTFKIRKNKSTPIYPQSNGQAEATNKTLSLILKKKLDEHKGRWCEQLHNVLWAYMTTRRSATGESPFLLTYGAEAVIPTEILMPTTKTEAWEKNLTTHMMLERLDDLEGRREAALQKMENYQRRLAREYNKKVKLRNFVEGQYVLRTIPQYQREKKWGNVAPTWGGPFIIHDIAGNGSYHLRNMKGEVLRHPWNAKWLKPYYP
uniref:Integrase catalytic domain-containing protein n=1 Tax=Papaver somniferum TaxID=3469 RepID=A0A5B7LJZ1_PAPSO|nr:putative uncharacterized protein [Papaver somniferum]